MKKLAIILLSAAMISAGAAPAALQPAVAEPDYSVDGGRIVIDFEDENDYKSFELYTEFDKKPWQMDGALYAWTLAEQKMILSGSVYSDVEVSVDISTINNCGKFDSGIYVMANSPSGKLDSINAWNVNVEHGATNSTMDLKLHRFENGSWKGIKTEVLGLPYSGDTINLRVVVKDGMLYAFLNGSKTPTFSYNVGQGSGFVGLRNFYSPNYFDNFTVTGAANAVYTADLVRAKAEAENALEQNLAADCVSELQAALALADQAVTQVEIDAAVKALEKALDRVVVVYTYDDLVQLIAVADTIENPDGNVYTYNSWSSLQAVKGICENLTAESSEYDISYWYGRLEARIDGLVAYIGGAE